jgi:serine/threonine protein kinase
VLLYEMVTGRLPFAAESQLVVVSMHINMRPPSPRNIVPTVSSQIEHVLYKALEKKPEQRYASATELAEAFCYAVSSNKNSNTHDNGKKPKVEHYEISASSEVRSESTRPSTTPVATIDAFSSQMALVYTGAGHQFKAPRTVFKIAPVQSKHGVDSKYSYTERSIRWSLFSQRITTTITPLKNWTSSPALRQGYAANNTLQIIAQGSSLSLYANGEFLVQLVDSTYTSGLIAFFATTDGVKQADVVYGNLKVYPMS